MGAGGSNQIKSSINITPLIDVLLVLLILFMVLTPILTKAMRSEIPQKVDQPIAEEYSEKQLVIHMTADGRFMLNKEDVGLAALPGRLREVFAERPGNKTVFLDADGRVLYGDVVQTMDLCRGAGAEQIAVIPDSIPPSR